VAESERDNLEADLSAFLDGELSEDRASRVQQALKESAEARRLLEQLRTTQRALRSLPRLSAPPELAERLRQAFERRVAKPQARATDLLRIIRIYGAWTATAAAVLLAFAAGRYSVEVPAVRTPSASEGITTRTPSASEGVALAHRKLADETSPNERSPMMERADTPPALDAPSADPAIAALPADLDETGREGIGAADAPAAAGAAGHVAGAAPQANGRGEEPQAAQLVEALSAAPGVVSVIVQTRTAEEFAASLSTVEGWVRESAGAPVPGEGPASEILGESHTEPVRLGLRFRQGSDEKRLEQGVGAGLFSAQLSVASGSLHELIARLEHGNPDGVVLAYRPSDAVVVQRILEPSSPAAVDEQRADGEHRRLADIGRGRPAGHPSAEDAQPRDTRDQAFGFPEPLRPQARGATPARRSGPERARPEGAESQESIAHVQRERPESELRQKPAASKKERAGRTLASRIAERMRDSLEAWVELADEALGRTAPPRTRPVLVRVTILPPAAEDVPSATPSPPSDSRPAP
jgi:hypothetical protein